MCNRNANEYAILWFKNYGNKENYFIWSQNGFFLLIIFSYLRVLCYVVIMSICIVIPSRLGSTRLPEKALADIQGKPMIVRVLEKAKKVRGVDEVIVATDHEKIVKAVESAGGIAVMTPESLQSGTDRVAYVAEMNKKYSIYVNVQGDEPMLDPASVEGAIELVKSKKFTMATPAAFIQNEENFKNPNVVKVLVAKNQRAVYFSRYPIPYSRGAIPTNFDGLSVKHHLGVYVYTAETLIEFSKLPKSDWEAAESLEQLRALYHGIDIGVSHAAKASIGVDTEPDLDAVRRAFVSS